MSRYIDADLLQEDFKADHGGKRSLMIDTQPTADVRENVRGEWLNMERIEDDKSEYITEWQQAQCSVCHKWHTTPYMYFFTHYNFCSNCGAPMTGETT